jgi:hypothetical protein
MAEHRWSNLIGVLKSTTPRQRLKALLFGMGGAIVVSSLALGYLQPQLDAMIPVRDPQPGRPESLPAMSLGQDATFMGRVVEQQHQQQQQAAELKALKTDNQELRATLQQALAQPQNKPDISRADVAQMINAQLAAARTAQMHPSPPLAALPPQPVLLSRFEPPSPPAATPRSALARNYAEPTPADAVALPAGSFALGIALNGFLAQSTGQSESVTVAFISDLSGPMESTIPMTGCRAVADCEAKDLIARGRCELSVVTCTLPRNRLVDIPVSGWLTGEDNVNGSFGTVIWNDHELLKRMAQATLPGVVAKLLKLTETTVQATSPTGVVTSSTASPLASIARDLSDLLLDRVRMFIYPIVAVDRNQRVNVYIRRTAYAIGTTPRDWAPRPIITMNAYN